MLVGETQNFPDATWRPYSPQALIYTFVDQDYGLKKIYTRLRNEYGETELMSDEIYYKPSNDGTGLTATLFPNPVKDRMNILIDENIDENVNTAVEVTVYTLAGNVYLTQTYNSSYFTLDLSTCPSGILLIKLTNGNNRKVINVIKL
jgi:hypothetical protein